MDPNQLVVELTLALRKDYEPECMEVLERARQWEPGSYGYWTDVTAEEDLLIEAVKQHNRERVSEHPRVRSMVRRVTATYSRKKRNAKWLMLTGKDLGPCDV